ncbi:MAG: hypothetical protein V3S55_10515 [Nitrospiraceae bacterium]
MEPGTTVVLASISCGLASICVVLSLWCFARLSKLEAKTDSLEVHLPHKRVKEMEAAFDALSTSYDAQLQKNAEWKQAVHNSVQRMDNIMRRNEAAREQLLDGDGNLRERSTDVDVVKGDLPESAVVDAVTMGKQESLRLRYNKNRGL